MPIVQHDITTRLHNTAAPGSTYYFLLRFKHTQLAKADMERRRLESSILLLDYYHVNCSGQGSSIDFRVKFLNINPIKIYQILRISLILDILISNLDIFDNVGEEAHSSEEGLGKVLKSFISLV